MSHKFHGIALANNSTIDNVVFERVAGTPSPLVQGRIWFDTTGQSFNYSDLDGNGAVRVNTFGSAAALAAAVASLTASIAAEAARATAAEQAEVTARQAAVNSINAALAQEVADRTNADSAEVAARQAGDAAVTAAFQAADAVVAQNAANALAAEASSRATDDAALGGRIDGLVTEVQTVQTSAGLNNDGTYTAPQNTTYLGSTTSLKGADVALDTALKAEVDARTSAISSVNAAVAAETARAEAAEANLQTQVTNYVNAQIGNVTAAEGAESAARIAADAALQTELDAAEAAVGLNGDGTFTAPTGTNYINAATTVMNAVELLDTAAGVNAAAIAAESTARATADTAFSNNLATEITNRTNADTNLQNEINATQVGAGLNTSGDYVQSTGANYIAAATSLADADNKLDSAVKAVSDRVGTLESTVIPEVQASVTAEVNRATAAEAALSSAITSASGTAAAAVAAETTRATAAEGTLTTNLAGEVTRATGAEAGLQSQIDSLVASSGEGAAALKTSLNNGRYAYSSTAPALVHNVTTGLSSLNFSVDLKVQGSDGVWRNDIAPIEYNADGSGFTVTLTESSNIKVSGQSNDAIA